MNTDIMASRPCLHCHEPLLPDQGILDDARRAKITLDFLPLRCRNAHTERLPLEPRPRIRYVPTCGYCEQPVTELKKNGKVGVLNHRACVEAHRRTAATKAHRYVEVEAMTDA